MTTNLFHFPKHLVDEAIARGRLPLCKLLQEAAGAVHMAVVEVGPSNLNHAGKAELYSRLLNAARDLELCANLLTRDILPSPITPGSDLRN